MNNPLVHYGCGREAPADRLPVYSSPSLLLVMPDTMLGVLRRSRGLAD